MRQSVLSSRIYNALRTAAVITLSVLLLRGVYEPLFHSPVSRRERMVSVRTHALKRGTPSRMRISRGTDRKGEGQKERERERERERLPLGLSSLERTSSFI